MSNQKRRALGRGLGALLPDSPKKSAVKKGQKDYFIAPIEEVFPNPEQPRKRFDEDQLAELAASIGEHGVIQPLIVRRRNEGGYYLIAGERRWRASQKAGLLEVPVVVQSVSPKGAFERAIVENLQRADLNPIEEAQAFARLVDDFDYTHDQVATRVGKDRSTVANAIRLLKLPAKVTAMVEDGSLSMGHARALLGQGEHADQERLARKVVAGGLSVRATERLVRAAEASEDKPTPQAPQKSASVRDVENRLTRALGTPAQLTENKRGHGGRIEIRYSDLDELDRLLDHMLKR